MRIAMFDGYGFGGVRRRRRRRRSGARRARRSGGRRGQRSRFAAAARACKGKTRGKFRACMRKKLRKRR